MPTMVVGYLLVKLNLIDYLRNIKVIGWTTLIFGIILFIADRNRFDKKISSNLLFFNEKERQQRGLVIERQIGSNKALFLQNWMGSTGLSQRLWKKQPISGEYVYTTFGHIEQQIIGPNKQYKYNKKSEKLKRFGFLNFPKKLL